ncbi:hypothetical protein C8J57DRAFT_1523410 [Mycena rebaudengoi]|nr:hypothetical protein C8J57DRAFT_1523410 [Mycena rebaudengoi]
MRLEGQLADEQLGRHSVMSGFTERDASRPEAMGLLDTTGGVQVVVYWRAALFEMYSTPGTLKLGRLEEEEEDDEEDRSAMKRKRTASLKITLDEVDRRRRPSRQLHSIACFFARSGFASYCSWTNSEWFIFLRPAPSGSLSKM